MTSRTAGRTCPFLAPPLSSLALSLSLPLPFSSPPPFSFSRFALILFSSFLVTFLFSSLSWAALSCSLCRSTPLPLLHFLPLSPSPPPPSFLPSLCLPLLPLPPIFLSFTLPSFTSPFFRCYPPLSLLGCNNIAHSRLSS